MNSVTTMRRMLSSFAWGAIHRSVERAPRKSTRLGGGLARRALRAEQLDALQRVRGVAAAALLPAGAQQHVVAARALVPALLAPAAVAHDLGQADPPDTQWHAADPRG